MALVRLALRNLQQKPSPVCLQTRINSLGNQVWRFSSAAEEKPADAAGEVAVADGGKKSKLASRRRGRRSLWRNNNREIVPALWEFFPSGLGNALIQATENLNRVMQNFSSRFLGGQAKEDDDCYKLRYQVPGLGKEDVKITVEDGVLCIRGEHKEEEEASDDEHWAAASSYGYYNASVVLPEDAKAEEITAEIKDGVLSIVIPKSQSAKKDVKEIRVH
ncbi:26.5 kDa heat shock protein, mitochondrial [Andrographis paniculata]|uniref:26.5 kDa heat shock protein, mitochondrial n=1 Tax=Andrographis paniculata TaxID=175694 RepID=UPI0021E73612|nr:26.5 kDa heat shock protein, mitochondrial [Andrographis paniculata]